MTLHVPCEYANLIEVEGQAVFGLGENSQVLRHFLIAVAHFIENEKCDDPLSLGILRDVEGHVEINHSRQYPSHAIVRIAD